MNSKNVLIVGAGVSGLTTALKLLQFGHKVTIYSKEPDGTLPSTSANAYAMWVPVKEDSDPRVERWATETFSELEKLSQDTATGIVMRQIFVLKQQYEEPWYAGKLAAFRHARPGEISNDYKDAHVLDTAPVIDPLFYLPWLRRQVLEAGGTIVQSPVNQFTNCSAEYTVIVNCSGLGSRQLAGDKVLHPVRVQVVKIKPTGFDKVVIDDDGPNKRSCIVPHANYIKIGAFFDVAEESLEIDDAVTRDILMRCSRMVPGFKADLSDVLDVVGPAPERTPTRVEIEKPAGGRPVIHNYGHDGMGYILSHGIAREIVGYVDAL